MMKRFLFAIGASLFLFNSASAETGDKTFFKTTQNYEGRFWSNGSWMMRAKSGGISRQDGDTMSVYCIDGVKMLISNESRQSYAVALPGTTSFGQACDVEGFSAGEIRLKDIPDWAKPQKELPKRKGKQLN